MFIKNDDLILLKQINKNIDNSKLDALIKRLEKEMVSTNTITKQKIAYMRKNGFPYYARSRKIQENHYKKYIKEIKYYIEQNEINVAMTIFKRIIKENSYTSKQLDYFMSTIPSEILEVYNSYCNE